jgi:dihydroorotase
VTAWPGVLGTDTSTPIALIGGRVVDPDSDTDGLQDLVLVDGRLIARGGNLDVPEGARFVDCQGLCVTPGLIDLHAHVYDGMANAVDPDVAGVHSGVTTVVDAGTAGARDVADFLDRLRPSCETRVEVLVNLATAGLASMPEITTVADVDLEATIAAVGGRRGDLSGIKVRIEEPAVAALGLDLIRMAKHVAGIHDVPLMVHVGAAGEARGCQALAPDVLRLLEAGDIVTHVMTPRPGGLFDDPSTVREACLAYDRGVGFDVGHGVGHFSFTLAEQLLGQGMSPHTISTDLSRRSRVVAAHSLTETMSKFLVLGYPLRDVVAMTTTGPACLLRRSDLGHLRVGEPVDVSILRIRPGPWLFVDSTGIERHGVEGIEPVAVVRGGRLIEAGDGPHPEGWLRSPVRPVDGAPMASPTEGPS